MRMKKGRSNETRLPRMILTGARDIHRRTLKNESILCCYFHDSPILYGYCALYYFIFILYIIIDKIFDEIMKKE